MKSRYVLLSMLAVVIGLASMLQAAAARATHVLPATILYDTVSAFIGANVIPVNREGVLGDQTVIVRGDRIVEVGARKNVKIPRGARRIDAKGRYLMPGLVDMHVHFSNAGQQGDLSLYLANGVTTIRNMNAIAGILDWREEIERGERIGPTIVTTGPTTRSLTDSAHAERVVREHVAAGFDAIKVYSGVAADPYRVLMRSAKAAGIPVVGHVPVEVGLEGAVRAGQRTLEHAEDLLQTHFQNKTDRSRMNAMADILKGSGVCVTPTLVVFSKVVKHFEQFPELTELMATPELVFVDPVRRLAWSPDNNSYVNRSRRAPERVPDLTRRVVGEFEFMKSITAKLDTAGVPILAGSDANVPFTIPGFSLLEELMFLVNDAHLTTTEALRAATLTPAECMGVAKEVGSVEVGKRADLILLDANPLSNVANVKNRIGVMVRGRWLTESELQTRMAVRAKR